MDGGKLNDLGKLSQRGLHSVFDMFEDMSYEEAMQYSDMDDQDQSQEIGAAEDGKFQSNDWVEDFFNKSQFKVDGYIQKALHQATPKDDRRPAYVKKIGKTE